MKLVEFTRQAFAHPRVRVVGVCFGHQIVGRALDAPVGRNEKGWEAAVNAVELSPKGKEIFGVDKLVCYYRPHVTRMVVVNLCHCFVLHIPPLLCYVAQYSTG